MSAATLSGAATNREVPVARPSFFIVGNSKSGTTAMSRFLEQHPDLFVCRPEEPNFFATDFCRDPDPTGLFHPRPEADYLAMFEEAQPGQRCGEASACYLYSEEAIANIAAFDPDARLIAIFREPVSFLRSYHVQLLKNPIKEGESEQDFERALALEAARRRGEQIPEGCLVPEFLFYSERVRYAEHLARVYQHVPKEQVLVLIYEDFRRDNPGTVRRVFEYLGVDPDFAPAFEQHNNGGQVVKSRRAQGLVHQLEHGRGPFGAVKRLAQAVVPAPVRKRLVKAAYQKAVLRTAERPDEALVAYLKQQFLPEVAAFSTLIGRDMVAEWGYDAIPNSR
ncbi:MAG: sulfotransferase [Bacteroidota bacterium]